MPIVLRYATETVGHLMFAPSDVANVTTNLRLIFFGGLIILFLVVEPEGLERLWRNVRNYFRVWPFAY